MDVVFLVCWSGMLIDGWQIKTYRTKFICKFELELRNWIVTFLSFKYYTSTRVVSPAVSITLHHWNLLYSVLCVRSQCHTSFLMMNIISLFQVEMQRKCEVSIKTHFIDSINFWKTFLKESCISRWQAKSLSSLNILVTHAQITHPNNRQTKGKCNVRLSEFRTVIINSTSYWSCILLWSDWSV